METGRHLKVRYSKQMAISPLTFKKMGPPKESSIRDHLLQCGNNTSFDELSILAHGNNKYLLEIKESIFIKHDLPFLNKNIRSTALHLFDQFHVIG